MPQIAQTPERGFFQLSNGMHKVLHTVVALKYSIDKDLNIGTDKQHKPCTIERRMDEAKFMTAHHLNQKFRGLKYGPTHRTNWSEDKVAPEHQLFSHAELLNYRNFSQSYYDKLFQGPRVVSQMEEMQAILDRFVSQYDRIPILAQNKREVKKARKYPHSGECLILDLLFFSRGLA